MNEELEEIFITCEKCLQTYELKESDAYFEPETYCSIECEEREDEMEDEED